MSINNYYIVALTKAAKVLVKEIRSNLRSGNYPDEIIEGLQVGTAKATEHGGEIRIVFTAPMSAAFERGSGEHGPDKQKYRIEPKDVGALAFEWDKTPAGPGEKFIGQAGDGRLLFRFVDHPGIEARPYIAPAIESKSKEMREILGSMAKIIVRDGRPRETVIK